MMYTSLAKANKAAKNLFLAGRAPSIWREASSRTSGYLYYVHCNE
jgi:hypothetical protein